MIKRNWFAACVPSAGIIGFAFVVAAQTAPAFAQLTIDTDRTTPVATSEAPVGEDLIIDSAGSIILSEPGTVLTIDSDTNVIVDIDVTGQIRGEITNTAASDGIGIDIDLTQNRTGSIDLSGQLQVGEFGVDLPLGANNTGIRIGSGDGAGIYTGDITFNPRTIFLVSGDESVGVELNQAVVGNITFDGAFQITGENSVGFISTAAITGQLTFNANIVARGGAISLSTDIEPISGPAVAIGASIAIDHDSDLGAATPETGGILLDGSIVNRDNRVPSQVRTIGGAPALYISPSITGAPDADIILGLYSDLSDTEVGGEITVDDPAFDGVFEAGVNDVGIFSVVNRGTIQSDGFEPGVNTEAFVIEGDGVNSVIFNGGIYNNGSISAQAVSHNLAATNAAEAASNATALIIGNGVDVPTLRNDGSIIGQTVGPAGGAGIGVLIEEGGNLPTLTNNSSISGLSLTNDDTDLANITAYAIWDRSGTLLNIDNKGLITANATETTVGSTAVAIDVSAATAPVTITNTRAEDGSSPSFVTGDILFGAADGNVLTIDGHVTDNNGVTLRSSVDGRVISTGSLDVSVKDGLLRTEEARVRDLTVGSAGAPSDEAGIVQFLLENTPNADPIINATGAVDFLANSTASFSSLGFLGADGIYTLLRATGGIDLHGRVVDELVTFDTPFLFNSSLDLESDAGIDTLSLVLQRKTAAELSLTGNSAAVYNAALMAAGNDDLFGRGLLAITDEVGVEQSLNSLIPNIGAGARALSIAVTDSIGGPVGRRQRSLIANPEQGLRFWGQQFYQDLNGASTATSPSFFGSGTGVSVGMEWGQTPTMRYGVSYTYFAGQVTETGAQTTKENIALNLASVYASWRANNFFVTPQANVGYASYDNRRRVVGGPITRRAISDWNSFLTSGGVTSGYVMDLGAFQLIPHVSIDGLYMHDTAYTERNGGNAVNLSLGSRTTRSVRLFAGFVAQTEFALDDGIMRPQILAGWSQDLVNDRPTIDASFEAAPGSEFSVVGPVSDSSRLIGGANFSYLFENWSAAFNYDASHSSGALSQSASLSMTSRF